MPGPDRDAEDRYPLQQPHHNGSRSHDDALEMEERESYADEETYSPFQLPPQRSRNALIIGIVAGVLYSIESIIIAFANSTSYQQASKYAATQIPSDLANKIGEVAVLAFSIGLLICVIAGFITGKVCIQRRYGFLAGFIAGIVSYGISFLLNYIPNYPGRLTGNVGATNAGLILGGVIVALILFLISGVFTGLVSLFGAWLATRKHPYYAG